MLDYLIAILTILLVYKGTKIINKKPLRPEQKIIKKGAGPYFWKRGDKGIILIHGYTSSAKDFVDAGKYLASKGITVYAPLLPGHGTTPEHLAHIKKQEWFNELDEAYKKISKHCKKIYVGGVSFGGNLALYLASKYKTNGAILMGTPIFFKNSKMLKLSLPLLSFFKNYKMKWYLDRANNTIRKNRISYDRFPLNNVKEVLNIIEFTSRRDVHYIKSPLLLIQSKTDFAVSSKSIDYICEKAKSRIKKVIWLDDAYHVVISDKKHKETVINEIYNFIKTN